LLSAVPQEFLTRTQKFVWLVIGEVVNEGVVATCVEMSPVVPWYHSYENGAVPLVVTVRVTVVPDPTVWLAGCVVMTGLSQVLIVGVSVEVGELTPPVVQAFFTCTQKFETWVTGGVV
jgi:hypothetical protein